MDTTVIRKQALAAREAHIALLDLKRIVDKATRTAHAAELETASRAVRATHGHETSSSPSIEMENLRNLDFEPTISHAREKLQSALLRYRSDAN